jgi:hypothetical protein
MRFGDTHVLAEVGVGINLAFGTIQSFRTWLIERVNVHLSLTVSRMRASEARLRNRPQSNGRSLAEAEAEVQRFKDNSNAFEVNFIGAAIVAVLVLISYITGATIYADRYCPWIISLCVLVTDVMVVGTWSVRLYSRYLQSDDILKQIETSFLKGIAFVEQELTEQELTSEVRPPVSVSPAPRRSRAHWLPLSVLTMEGHLRGHLIAVPRASGNGLRRPART